LVCNWTRSEVVYGPGAPVEHPVQQLECSRCKTLILVDLVTDKVLNVYAPVGKGSPAALLDAAIRGQGNDAGEGGAADA
jgi:hypothetical protein